MIILSASLPKYLMKISNYYGILIRVCLLFYFYIYPFHLHLYTWRNLSASVGYNVCYRSLLCTPRTIALYVHLWLLRLFPHESHCKFIQVFAVCWNFACCNSATFLIYFYSYSFKLNSKDLLSIHRTHLLCNYELNDLKNLTLLKLAVNVNCAMYPNLINVNTVFP